VIAKVKAFWSFAVERNEHDYGAFAVENDTFCWIIRYYNRTLDGYSEDPTNTDITVRILTIMLSREY
jgi:hypothetical protein